MPEHKSIEELKEYAQRAFEEVGSLDQTPSIYEDARVEAGWMQNILLAEIAGTLARQATASERIVALLDGFRVTGLPVEQVN